jgi:hypothetical protein
MIASTAGAYYILPLRASATSASESFKFLERLLLA